MDEITQILHEALLAVKEAVDSGDPPDWFDAWDGICLNVRSLAAQTNPSKMRALEERLRSLIAAWPERGMFTLMFPVAGAEEYQSSSLGRIRWANSRRLQLLDWLIAETE